MNISNKRPLNLFFIEIIIALLFFSISGAVILSVFAGADRRSHKSELLESVMVYSQSIAEVYAVSGNADETLKTVEKECGRLDESIALSKFEEKTENTAGTLSKLTLRFTENGEEIYKFTCSAYIQNGGNNEQT